MICAILRLVHRTHCYIIFIYSVMFLSLPLLSEKLVISYIFHERIIYYKKNKIVNKVRVTTMVVNKMYCYFDKDNLTS
jgi:hypothetical protein